MVLVKRFKLGLLLFFLEVIKSQNHDGSISCIDSLNKIYSAERDVNDESVLRVYVLCPNTDFDVADAFESDGSPSENKQYPIVISRSNIHILCGEDGNSNNNCVIEGGLIQLEFSDSFGANQANVNTVVKGATFTDAQTKNVVINHRGSIMLIDCVFSRNNNEKLIDVGPETLDVDLDVNVTISGCVFSDNRIWSYSGKSIEGLVHVRGGSTLIRDTIFLRNTVDESTKLEYAIGLFEGKLGIEHSCFIDNSDALVPVAWEDGILNVQYNSVQRNTSTLPVTKCDFVSRGDLKNLDYNETLFTCLNADSPLCTAGATMSNVETTCLKSLSDIYNLERFLESDGATRTYRLCKNYIYHIRVSDGNEVDEDFQADTTTPLTIGRSNLYILCGADGNSSNNCSFSGGMRQVEIIDEYQTGVTFENILISGVTFEKALSYNVISDSNNNVTFYDCIFKDNDYDAAILIDLDMSESERGVLDRRNTARILDHTINENVHHGILVMHSIFVNNVVGSAQRGFAGLVVSQKGNVRLIHNTFYGTRINVSDKGDIINKNSHATSSNDDVDVEAFVIVNNEGNLDISGNCFLASATSITPVLSYRGTLVHSTNGGTTISNATAFGVCEFLLKEKSDDGQHHEDTIVMDEDSPYICIPFDAVDKCDEITNTNLLQLGNIPRGIPSNTVIDAGGIPDDDKNVDDDKDDVVVNATSSGPLSSPSTSLSRINTGLIILLGLAGAVLVTTFLIIAYNVRRGSMPVQLPTFRSDPIPPIL